MNISDLRHRIRLCSADDVVVANGAMELSRREVVTCWAHIKSLSNLPSFLSRMGYAIKEGFDRETHVITVRAHLGLSVTSAAWVYEEFRVSEPRWYKVIGFSEQDSWLALSCHLVERSDLAQPPTGDLVAKASDILL